MSLFLFCYICLYFFFLYFTYKWKYTAFVFLWFASVSIKPSSSISVQLCIYIYIFFIYVSVDEHLGCFHILVIVNNKATIIGAHISFLIRVFYFWGAIYPVMELLDYTEVLFNCLRKLYTIYLSGLHSQQKWTKCPFLHISAPFCVRTGDPFCLFDYCHSDSSEVTPHCGFDLRFSND